MIRLHVVVEGQAEETFVNEVLAPDLGAHEVFADCHRITTGRRHGRLFRGGFVVYEHLARDLSLWMKQDDHADSWFTTVVDFYKIPADFPGKSTVPHNSTIHQKVAHFEAQFANDMVRRMGAAPVSKRLVPYIQTHEFEAMLFSDATGFLKAFPDRHELIDRLKAIRAQFDSPEEINEGASPSKRILQFLPEYQKSVAGIIVAQAIGLPVIRRECRHFDKWVARLIGLAAGTGGQSPSQP